MFSKNKYLITESEKHNFEKSKVRKVKSLFTNHVEIKHRLSDRFSNRKYESDMFLNLCRAQVKI